VSTSHDRCLFNLTADIGERDDLGQNPAYQVSIQI
jgi:hypothetical protein